MNTLLEVKNICYSVDKSFGFLKKRQKLNIIKSLSSEFLEGEILAIVGESGCGKTTLAKLITGVLPIDSGEIVINVTKENRSNPIQILFQNSEDLINPLRKCKSLLHDASANSDFILETVSNLDINPNLLNSWGYQLSGGERQRIALARLLLTNPKILILDEPFSAQDTKSKVNFIELLKNLNMKNNLTIVCITHDLELLNDFTDRIFVMYGGKIIESSKTSKYFTSPHHPYSKFLQESGMYKLKREDISFKGNNESKVCDYYERCERKTDICKISVTAAINDYSTTLCNHPY